MPDVTELLHSARRAVEAGDHKAALLLLDEAARLGPNLFGVHMLRGICLSALDRPAEGVKALQRAIELNPTSAQGHYNLGVALRAAKRDKEAERHFRQALRLQPGYEAAADAIRSLAPEPSPRRAPAPTPAAPSSAEQPAKPPSPPRRSRPAAGPLPSPRKLAFLAWGAVACAVALAAGTVIWVAARDRTPSWVAWQAPGDFAALDFSPDGELLVTGGKKVTVWRVGTGTKYRDFGWGEEAVDLAFLPTGAAIAISSRDERTGRNVKLWRMPDSGLVAILPQNAGSRPLAFSPDGKLLAIGTDYMSAASPLGVQLWSVPDRKVIGAVATPDPVAPGYVTAIAFSADSRLLASADDSGTIWITDVATREQLSAIQTGNMMSVSLAFSPSGKALAYGGSSGPDVTICSLPSGDPVQTLKGGSRPGGKLDLPQAVKALAFSPDGHLLATSVGTGDDTRLHLFRLPEGEPVRALDSSLLFSSLGPEAQSPQATGEGGSTPHAPEASAKGARLLDIRDLQFSPDGHYLAWCGSRGVAVARVADLTG
ncbi:MAG: tetratricopeptide repeat protein [Armatimonadota bacterium]